jgi:hypothetical protein
MVWPADVVRGQTDGRSERKVSLTRGNVAYFAQSWIDCSNAP